MSTGFNEEEPIPPAARYRRAYLAVFLEGIGEAIIEESKLRNNPNGDAGITILGRLFRVGFKGLAYGMRQNSINLSKSLGAKWRVLGPMDFIMDKGTCGIYCDNPDPEQD